MNDEEFNEESRLTEWSLELEKIRKQKQYSAVTRLLAATLMINPYMSVGTFFQTISDEDLQTLLEKAEEIKEFDGSESPGTEEILLIAMMLAQAEGSPAQNMEELHDNISILTVLIAGTSLARKGLVEACYDNMSFGPDMRDAKVFIRKTDVA